MTWHDDVERDWSRFVDAVRRLSADGVQRPADEVVDESDARPFDAPRLDRLVARVAARIDGAPTLRTSPPAAPDSPATATGAAAFGAPRLIDLARRCTPDDAALAALLGRPADAPIPAAPDDAYARGLARALDWCTAEVRDALGWPARSTPSGDAPFEELDARAAAAFRAGRFEEMTLLADQALRIAASPAERARACNRASGAWDGLGAFERARDAARAGLRERDLPDDLRAMLRSNLANAHYTLWEPHEAAAIATAILDGRREQAPTTPRARRNEAWSLYVRGHAHRRLMDLAPDDRAVHAEQARRDLRRAETLWTALATEEDHEGHRGIAHTCRGGILEADVELGRIDAAEALATITGRLSELLETPRDPLVGSMLESAGWWCVFASNVAARHPEAGRPDAFLDAAYRIALMLPNWALRERVLTLEWLNERRRPCDIPRARLVVGAMGRFPRFRPTGWRILAGA